MASNLETKIDRIATAVTSALSALTAKGVTVPDGANVESLAALIESIEAGGGGGNNVAYGTIIPEDMKAATLVIEHGLGVVPKFVFICAAENDNGVYSTSKPNGQSFIYAFSPKMTNGIQWYYSRYLHASSSMTNYNEGSIGESISSGFSYYIAINDTSIIWANRNTSYGFGNLQSPFFWIAMKEVN